MNWALVELPESLVFPGEPPHVGNQNIRGVQDQMADLQRQMADLRRQMAEVISTQKAKNDGSTADLASPQPRSSKPSKRRIALFTIGTLIALGGWLQPVISSHIGIDRRHEIDDEVRAQLAQPLQLLNQVSLDVAEIKGELRRISLNGFAAADNQTFAKSLPDLRRAMAQPVADVSRDTLEHLALKLHQTPQSSPEYWPTTLQFIGFASASLAPEGVPTDSMQASLFLEGGTIDGVTYPNQKIVLKSGVLANVTFEKCRIVFQEPATPAPLVMQNVTFIECVFEFPITIRPSPIMQRVAESLLASGVKSASIPNS